MNMNVKVSFFQKDQSGKEMFHGQQIYKLPTVGCEQGSNSM